jgi:8-oxo-(d)GTP phosphatase
MGSRAPVVTVLLIRHAVAKSRHRWEGPDDRRPLTRRGRGQASDLVRLLAEFPVDRILSSPSVRCLDTVAPLAENRRMKLERAPALAEGRARKAIQLVSGLLDDDADVALCSHGDVIPAVLAAIDYDGVDLRRGAKGATWVLDPTAGKATYIPAPS